MRRDGHPLVAAQELTAHAEVHDEHVAVVEGRKDVFPLALDAGDLSALEHRREVLAPGVPADRAHRVLRGTHLDRFHPAADDVLLQIAAHDLDLG